MNGMPLFIPYCLRSKTIVPAIVPEPEPAPETVNVSFSVFVTPRIVKFPSTSKVVGPVCTSLVDLNEISGLFLTSKKSLLFSLLFFIPLPVSTLSAWISTSNLPDETSADMNVRLAVHLSKVPLIDTDASTSNFMWLCTGVIAKTGTPAGACAKAAEENRTDTRKANKVRRMLGRVRVFFDRVNQHSRISESE